jgi:hypothetical protein
MSETKAVSELQRRCQWGVVLISELVNTGREQGWLSGKPSEQSIDSDSVIAASNVANSAMSALAMRLGLSEVELDLLWLLACIELDPHVSTAALLLVPAGMNELSAQLLERLVGRSEPLDGDVFGRLARFGLIHSDTRAPMNRRVVRAHERVIELARGQLRLDSKLEGIAVLESAIEVRRKTVGGDHVLPQELRSVANAVNTLFVAAGAEGTGRSTKLRQAISACGRASLMVSAVALSSDDSTFISQMRGIARECRLHDAWPVFTGVDALSANVRTFEREFLSTFSGPIFATSNEACAWSIARSIINVPFAIPSVVARVSIWRRALAQVNADVLHASAQRYSVTPGVIEKAARTASALAGDASGVEMTHIHRALRTHLERRLTGIARRIETKQTWNDLVLPIDQFDLLIEMVARVRHKQRVLEDWGFADKVGRGLGLSALLSGPPGTGKTMIAGLMAQELGLDLYQVDLSKVVSKYIGETEKQLSALFEAAESGHAILLFDEADSFFAKRTEVKSSNDRYANLEVNYLLQRIEVVLRHHRPHDEPRDLHRQSFPTATRVSRPNSNAGGARARTAVALDDA